MKGIEEILFGASGHLSDEAIALYAEALVYGKEDELPDSVLDHVEECLSCKQKIIGACEIWQEKAEGTSLNIKKQKLSGRLVWRIAAAILILFGTSLTVLILRNNRSEKVQDIVMGSDSSQNDQIPDVEIAEKDIVDDTIVKEHGILLAQNFNESDLFETLTETVFRSETELEILSPENNESFAKGQEISFSWKADKDARYTIRLYNNRELEPIYEARDLESEFLLGEDLEQGLYYWKLESEEDLLFVGKFLILER